MNIFLRTVATCVILLGLIRPAHTFAQNNPPTVPWTTYEAEDMKTTGKIVGPLYGPNSIATESSGERYVKLDATGQYVEFAAQSPANALVVRYCVPDSTNGGGIDATISLYQNGKFVQKLPVTSRYSWQYGRYPFTNDPHAGKPRHFYDEVRLKDLSIAAGDVLRLSRDAEDTAPYYIIDLVDLESVAPPLSPPVNSLSIANFGADGKGATNDTAALRACIHAAREQAKIVWVPAGTYILIGDIDLPSNVTIQGAGMWHTTFLGDASVYDDAYRRVRFNGRGNNIHLADFAIIGRLTYRSDHEPNDSLTGSYGTNSTISRIWVEHTKTGAWIVNSRGLIVDGCRMRDTMADGINFCVGMRDCVITNCTTRGTGDDCFAIWPAVYAEQKYAPGHNVVTHCVAQLPYLANGGAIYGGEGNRIEDCLFKDISVGCGVLISTTFPVSSVARNVDNSFSGTTVVQRCKIVRCGGDDHGWEWRAAVQLCLDRHNLSGIDLNHLDITDSLSDGLSIISHGNDPTNRDNTLSQASIDNVNIPNYGIGVSGRHGLWIDGNVRGGVTISNSKIVETRNDSPDFTIKQLP